MDTAEAAKIANLGYSTEDSWFDHWNQFMSGGQPRTSGMVEERLPSWLQELSPRLIEQKILTRPFNHALINEYEPGQGIMVD